MMLRVRSCCLASMGCKAPYLPYLGLLLAMFVLGGCAGTDTSAPDWSGVKGDAKPAKLVEFSETAKFATIWHGSVGDSGANFLQPAMTMDAVYGVSGKGTLTRLDRASGKQMWRIESGITVTGGIGSGAGLLLIGGEKGDVLAFGEDGKLRWKTKVSSEVLNVSQVADGLVLVRSGDGHITALNVADGKREWLYERSTPALVVRSHAGVVIQRGVAYAGFAGGKVAAIKIKDGSVLWENAASQPRGSTELERISDITSAPVVDDEQVCAIAFQGRVACFEMASGNPIWSREISSDKGMTLLRKYLYLSDANGSVIALDKITGSTVWKNDRLTLRDVAQPFVQDDYVVIGDYEGYLHALSRDDGSFAARIKLGGGAIGAEILQRDDGLLVQTRGGDVYSLLLKPTATAAASKDKASSASPYSLAP